MTTRAELAFKALDVDGSGFITGRELRKLSSKLSSPELAAIMKKVVLLTWFFNCHFVWKACERYLSKNYQYFDWQGISNTFIICTQNDSAKKALQEVFNIHPNIQQQFISSLMWTVMVSWPTMSSGKCLDKFGKYAFTELFVYFLWLSTGYRQELSPGCTITFLESLVFSLMPWMLYGLKRPLAFYLILIAGIATPRRLAVILGPWTSKSNFLVAQHSICIFFSSSSCPSIVCGMQDCGSCGGQWGAEGSGRAGSPQTKSKFKIHTKPKKLN